TPGGLARTQAAYRASGKGPSAIELHREPNALKRTELPWLTQVSECASQEAVRHLDRAFAHFPRRCQLKRAGKLRGKAGSPRLKTKKRGLGSFRLAGFYRRTVRRYSAAAAGAPPPLRSAAICRWPALKGSLPAPRECLNRPGAGR